MNNEEKNSLLSKTIQDKISANKEEWASMWVVVESQKLMEKPDQSEIAKASLRMKECEDRITLLEKLLIGPAAE